MIRLKHLLIEQTRVSPTTYNTVSIETTMQTLTRDIANYNPNTGYIAITNGNLWLATQRSNSLRDLLLQPETKDSIGITRPINPNWIRIQPPTVQGEGQANQKVVGTLQARLFRPEERQEEYPYKIDYEWHEINNVPHILVTKQGLGAPQPHNVNKTGANSELDVNKDTAVYNKMKQFQNKIPENNTKILRALSGAGTAQGPVYTDTTWGIMIPVPQDLYKYVAKQGTFIYFTKEQKDSYIKTKDMITKYVDNTGIRTGENYTDFTQVRGSGDTQFGNATGRSATAWDKQGNYNNSSQVNVVSYDKSTTGNVPGQVIAGKEEKWETLDVINLDENYFIANMISLKPDTYNTIFANIKNILANKFEQEQLAFVDLAVTIQGFASTARATNRLSGGLTTPDHDYGGRLPANLWIYR